MKSFCSLVKRCEKLKLKTVFIILNVLLLSSVIKADNEKFNEGPVDLVMKNLASYTAQVTDEMQIDLSKKLDRSIDDISGNIEVITAAAMEQLGDAVFQAQSKLQSCPQNWTMTQLFSRIDGQLTNCTTNLLNLRTVFQNESQTLLQALRAYVSQLSNIPAQCAMFNSSNFNEVTTNSFASSTACFVLLLAELNQNVSQLVTQSQASLVRTRQSTRAGVTAATSCSTQVVYEIEKFLTDAFKNC